MTFNNVIFESLFFDSPLWTPRELTPCKIHFFFKQRIFLNSTSALLNFLMNKRQMLLKCCLLHIDMILPKHATFCIFVFMSASRSINYIILYDLSFIMIFNFIAINHIISGTQPHLLIWTLLSKVQPQSVSFCLFFLTISDWRYL